MAFEEPKRRVFVTGFGSFGTHSVNPSWLAVKKMYDTWSGAEELIIKEVPVIYQYVKEEIPQIWNELKPDLVIHVGVSPVQPGVIHLETCAHSDGYIRLDISQCCGPNSTRDAKCLQTSLNVNKIVDNCSDVFPVVKMSTDAGRYLCEYIFYTSLNMEKSPVLFIHVPVVDDESTVEKIAEALSKIVRCCLEQLPLEQKTC